jgi:amino acid permease
MSRRFLLATGLLAGTIIGAGIFSLPYVFSQVGLLTGAIFLGIFSVVYYYIHRMYAELCLTRDERHNFISLAESYMSRPAAVFASFSILIELIFVLAVYLVLIPSFSELVLPGSGALALVLFWILGSLFIFVRLDILGVAESFDVLGILCIVFSIGVAGGLSRITVPALQPLTAAAFFLPFGPLLFSLSGRPAIPEVVAEHRRAAAEGHPFSLAKAIGWGTALPALLYLGFSLAVLRISPDASPDALSGLTMLPRSLMALLGGVGIVTLWTSYFMIGLNVKDILRFDLKLGRFAAGALVVVLPLMLYAMGFQHFLEAVSFTGGVFLGLEGLFVIAMWRRAFPDHPRRWIGIPLYAVFAAAAAYAVVTALS